MHDEESQIIKFSMGQYDKRTVNGNVSKSESAPARTSGLEPSPLRWGGILARNHEMLKQSEVDDATMRIEVSRYCTWISPTHTQQDPSRVVGSGFIQFPPQRPFQQSVIVQPPTVVVRSTRELTTKYLTHDKQVHGETNGSATASGSAVRLAETNFTFTCWHCRHRFLNSQNKSIDRPYRL